ncbi:MAG: N-acetylglucosamine-6-phosphate deacetylase, partial [Aristaeellaceae bacterium]
AAGVLANGVTSFLPTTMTVDWNQLETVFRQLRKLKAESLRPDFPGAEILGCHAEGPFINPARKGAQAASAILPPDAQRVLPFRDIIRIITYAPEMPGGLEFTHALRQQSDIRLSIGHTSASYDQAVEAIGLGASRVTHTFNAQTPLHHRDPGVVGAALTQPVDCELIADTFHVHPGVFTLMDRAKDDHLVLITDCTRAGGLADGEYTLGGQPIFVKGIECRLADGTIAGSVLKLNDAVRNFRDHASVPMWKAVRAASLNAAASAGVAARKGSLESGKDADIILLDSNCRVLQTYVRGTCRYTH